MTTLHLENSISRSPLWRGFLLIPVVLTCFAFWPAPKAFGVSPPPDGGYPIANTAEGTDALYSLDTAINPGVNNTAIGFDALYDSTTGSDNTAVGNEALENNITGSNNTANGSGALYNNTARDNTANGYQALYSNTTGATNTASGHQVLYYNTTGNNNTAIGNYALYDNTTGSFNIALGDSAGTDLTTGNLNIDIGNNGIPGEGNTIRIGSTSQNATYIAGISGVAVTGVGVIVSSSGQLGVASSSERFKDQIKAMDKASEAILALRPVTFRYKRELDPAGIPQFGLVAEEVEKVNPDLVVRDAEGKVFTVRYDAVNAMLLNEFLKEHRAVQELKSVVAKQEAIIAQQQNGMKAFAARLEKQDSKIEKVSAQLELNKTAPRTVANN